MEYKKEKVVKP